ncbi:DUF6510 family protein [Microbacterium lacus]|uniref:DUF6510 family protein n=1 Tax=Microbacterium lacus TaxID=415217 RepID=UPI0038512621
MRAEIAATTVDGNVLAGLLSDVFTGDVTTIIGVCAGCDSQAPLAEAIVEIDEVAAIVRCRGCSHTLFTVMRDDSGVRVMIASLSSFRRGFLRS